MAKLTWEYVSMQHQQHGERGFCAFGGCETEPCPTFRKITREALEVNFEEKNEEFERKLYRAAIRFAPGPYGEVFTDWYIGQKGANLAVYQFCSVFKRTT